MPLLYYLLCLLLVYPTRTFKLQAGTEPPLTSAVLNRARVALVLSALVYDDTVCGNATWTTSDPGASARLAALASLFPAHVQDAVRNQLRITRIEGSSTVQVRQRQ